MKSTLLPLCIRYDSSSLTDERLLTCFVAAVANCSSLSTAVLGLFDWKGELTAYCWRPLAEAEQIKLREIWAQVGCEAEDRVQFVSLRGRMKNKAVWQACLREVFCSPIWQAQMLLRTNVLEEAYLGLLQLEANLADKSPSPSLDLEKPQL